MIQIPEKCYALLPISIQDGVGEVIIIHPFTKGYTPTGRYANEKEIMDLNTWAKEPVSWAQAQAMFDCSMFGWNKYLDMLKLFTEAELERGK